MSLIRRPLEDRWRIAKSFVAEFSCKSEKPKAILRIWIAVSSCL
jgi:hypothetical protein